mgnify:CR=1 FL=1
MGILSLILGMLSFTGVCISLVPLLNILNCITLPVAMIGAIFGLADLLNKDDRKGAAIGGMILCGLALLVGGARAIISLVTTGGIV